MVQLKHGKCVCNCICVQLSQVSSSQGSRGGGTRNMIHWKTDNGIVSHFFCPILSFLNTIINCMNEHSFAELPQLFNLVDCLLQVMEQGFYHVLLCLGPLRQPHVVVPQLRVHCLHRPLNTCKRLAQAPASVLVSMTGMSQLCTKRTQSYKSSLPGTPSIFLLGSRHVMACKVVVKTQQDEVAASGVSFHKCACTRVTKDALCLQTANIRVCTAHRTAQRNHRHGGDVACSLPSSKPAAGNCCR